MDTIFRCLVICHCVLFSLVGLPCIIFIDLALVLFFGCAFVVIINVISFMNTMCRLYVIIFFVRD